MFVPPYLLHCRAGSYHLYLDEETHLEAGEGGCVEGGGVPHPLHYTEAGRHALQHLTSSNVVVAPTILLLIKVIRASETRSIYLATSFLNLIPLL